MSFRYINPGYIHLLDSDCVATQLTGTQYSNSGVAFTQTANAGVTLLNFVEGDEFWAKFDMYVSQSFTVTCLVPRVSYGYLYITTQSTSLTEVQIEEGMGSSGRTRIFSGSADEAGIKFNGINSVVLHVIYGSASTSLVEVIINKKKFQLTGREIVYGSSSSRNFRLFASNNNVYFSNIILSDEEISPRERVVALPAVSTVTDMTAGESGIYIANAANQQLLQAVDVSTLASNYGADSAVTGMAVVGNPAYATGMGITTLKGVSKSGGVVTEHGTCDLTGNTSAVIMDGWGLSGVTLADLANMQFGWKVGE